MSSDEDDVLEFEEVINSIYFLAKQTIVRHTLALGSKSFFLKYLAVFDCCLSF